MRCLACDKSLTEFEATRKYAGTTKYIDLCNHCFSTISDQVYVTERWDLKHSSDTDDEESDEEGLTSL